MSYKLLALRLASKTESTIQGVLQDPKELAVREGFEPSVPFWGTAL